VTLLRRDLDRRRKKLAGRLMESVETSTAEGAKDFNVAMRGTVKAVREARGIAEDDALTEVLDRIHRKFPPGDLARMDEGESVARMREVLSEIEADIRGETEEGPNAIGEGAGGAETRPDEDAATEEATNEESGDERDAGRSSSDSSASDSPLDEAPTEEASEASARDAGAIGSKAVTLTDLASLARSTNVPEPRSIWDEAREEREAEAREARERARAEEAAEEEARAEAIRGKNATWDALDALTKSVDERLREEEERTGER
jgi:hypothetical protein